MAGWSDIVDQLVTVIAGLTPSVSASKTYHAVPSRKNLEETADSIFDRAFEIASDTSIAGPMFGSSLREIRRTTQVRMGYLDREDTRTLEKRMGADVEVIVNGLDNKLANWTADMRRCEFVSSSIARNIGGTDGKHLQTITLEITYQISV